MLVLNNSYELSATYLQVFLLWMFFSQLVLSFPCVYFVVTGHFMPVWGLSILRANLASTEKSTAEKVSLYLGQSLQVKSWKAEVTAEKKQTQDYNQNFVTQAHNS